MKMTCCEAQRTFHLHTPEMSYAFGWAEDGRILHLYWGKALGCDEALAPIAAERLQPSAQLRGTGHQVFEDFELSTREPGDFGEPVVWPRHADGSRGTRLRYVRHEIRGEELTVWAADRDYPFEVELHYRGWGDLPLLSRWIVVRNPSGEAIELQSVKSAAWHLPRGLDWRLTHMAGSWGAEYGKNQLMLTQARTVLQNDRLTCEGAQQTPFFALDERGQSTAQTGEVFYGVLHWSGDFSINVERQYGKNVSVTGGVNHFDAKWNLKPGESLTTPMFTCGFSAQGFDHMSETLYDWQYDFLLPRGRKINKAAAERPVIYNSWYPYTFHVDEENCTGLLEECARLGVELFVIDDGWMPGRVSDRTGLGDWVHDEKRFPNGLAPIARACHEKGMLFGLWVEPEMVNPNSELYRAHPDWVIHDPKRERTLQRSQLILNMARDDVRDWAIEQLDRVIEEYELDYLKWDMNRYVTETGWPDAPREEQQSLAIRYIQNIEKIWQHMNEKYPDLLLENCASGGGRSDFGMVPYADRINRSDNADPVDVMVLHENFTTLFIPKTAGGAGTIAPERHHIHERQTPLDFRIRWGMTGSMGIGINLLTASDEIKAGLKKGIAEFKTRRADLQNAYVYTLASATENPYAVFEYVRRDRKAFTVFAFSHGMRCWDLEMPRFRMRGLIPDALYECEDGRRMRGDVLMNYGFACPMKGDYSSVLSAWKIVE